MNRGRSRSCSPQQGFEVEPCCPTCFREARSLSPEIQARCANSITLSSAGQSTAQLVRPPVASPLVPLNFVVPTPVSTPSSWDSRLPTAPCRGLVSTSTPLVGASALHSSLILIAFCLHNAWNCWGFLNASSAVSESQELYAVSETQLGLCNTLGLAGIFAALPVAMLCRWRRSLLGFAIALNVTAPVARWIGATTGNYVLVVMSFFGQGAAFSVIGVWPPIIGMSLFREDWRALAIACGALSNYLGGAMASGLTPVFTGGTSQGLLALLRYQCIISAVLFVVALILLWIPDVRERAPALGKEIAACRKMSVAPLLVSGGMLLGIGTILQNTLQPVLEGLGFSEGIAGACNCILQVSSVFVGVGIGNFVTRSSQLIRVLRWLHVIAVVSCAGMLVLSCLVNVYGTSTMACVFLLCVHAIEGASVVGLTPFFFMQAVCIAQGATENFITGLMLLICMSLSSGLNQVCVMIPPVQAVALVFVMMTLEAAGYFWFDRRVLREQGSFALG